jgi:hypothetical protein
MNFKEWFLNETLKFSDAQKVQGKLTDYKPGTFGIEIEFVPTKEVDEARAKRAWDEYLINNDETLRDNFKESKKRKVESPEEWLNNHPKPDKEDFKDYQDYLDTLHDWKQDKIDNFNDFMYAFWEWRNDLNWEDHLDKEDFLYKTNVKADIALAGKILKDLGEEWVEDNSTPTKWGVGEDYENIEIRSKYLTVQDIPKLEKILYKLKKSVKTTGGTSAHVHVGLQQFEDFNMVDLLATVKLIDENKMYQLAGPTRESKWALSKQKVADFLFDKIKENKLLNDTKEEIISNETLKEIIKSIETKYLGTNIKSFTKIGTVEFRYLSSLVLNQIDEFIETIQYFLMIPYIARRQDSVKLLTSSNQPIYFTRMPNNQVKISTTSTRKSGESIESTRKIIPPTKFQQRKEELKAQNKITSGKGYTFELEDAVNDNNIIAIENIINKNPNDISYIVNYAFQHAIDHLNMYIIKHLTKKHKQIISDKAIKLAVKTAIQSNDPKLIQFVRDNVVKDYQIYQSLNDMLPEKLRNTEEELMISDLISDD